LRRGIRFTASLTAHTRAAVLAALTYTRFQARGRSVMPFA
jgi:hypothetical protein